MQNNFAQPDPNTCVPTSFAYLLYKEKGIDFQKTLNSLVKECYKRYDLEKDGMEFDQMKEVAETLGIPCVFSLEKPQSKNYLVGVVKLPKCEFESSDVIRQAMKENALQIKDDYFIYPYAHSIVVSENIDGTATIFDSYLGTERSISLEELEKDLEKPLSYLSLS